VMIGIVADSCIKSEFGLSSTPLGSMTTICAKKIL